MERIIELFCELQRELLTFVEKANRQLSTPRCDFGCTHCNGRSTVKGNYESSSYKGYRDYSPEYDERFEQSELQISQVIENYVNVNEGDGQNNRHECDNDDYVQPAVDEVPEEMTISEGSLSSLEDGAGEGAEECEKEDAHETENDDGEENHPEDENGDDNEKENCQEDENNAVEVMQPSVEEKGEEESAETIDKRTCKYCDRIFLFPYQVKRHELVHSGTNPYRCLGCRNTFAGRSSLLAHKVYCKESILTCLDCGTQFRNAKKLKQHAAAVHSKYPEKPVRPKPVQKPGKSRPFKCHVCTRFFATNTALSKHMTVHSDSKRYECPECGKQYSYMERLKNHLRIFHPHLVDAQ